MNVRKIEKIFNGAVNARQKVTLEVTNEQSDELREALKVVEKYKQAAIKALKYKEMIKGSDWHMFEYAVKSDCVIVDVQNGACG